MRGRLKEFVRLEQQKPVQDKKFYHEEGSANDETGTWETLGSEFWQCRDQADDRSGVGHGPEPEIQRFSPRN
jgi:hypothetical protein